MAPVLFINKGVTSQSLSRSNGAEKSLIFSHVQRPSQSRPPITASKTSAVPDPIRCEKVMPDNEATEPKKRRAVTARCRRPSPETIASQKCRMPITHLSMPSPLKEVDIAALDPFHSTAAPITRYMTFVLEFYRGTLLDRVYPSKILADVSRKHTLAYASKDAVTLNAILCVTCGTLYAHFRDVKYGLHAAYFKGQAIHHLKNELSKVDVHNRKVSTAYAVSLLLWIECLQGDMKAVETHLRGLDHLVSRVPELESSPVPIMTTIYSSSYYCAVMLRIPPVLKPPRPFLEPILSSQAQELLNSPNDPKFERLGTRFFTALNANLIGPTLLGIISEQRSCILFKELCLAERFIPILDDIKIMDTAQLATDYHLLSLPFLVESTDLTPTRDAVRLAVYLFAQPIMTIATQSSAFSLSMSKQLKQALENGNNPSSPWDTSLDLLLWVLFIGAQFSYGQAEWSWFASQIAATVKILDIHSMKQMRNILIGFYHSNFLETVLEALWHEHDIFDASDNGYRPDLKVGGC